MLVVLEALQPLPMLEQLVQLPMLVLQELRLLLEVPERLSMLVQLPLPLPLEVLAQQPTLLILM
jgi:hypothetical protein